MLSNRIEEYYFISQGKTRIPGVNDGTEFELTDVSIRSNDSNRILGNSVI